MAKEEARGPVSSAGLVRYFDVSGGGIEVGPEVIVGFAFLVIILVLALDFVF